MLAKSALNIFRHNVAVVLAWKARLLRRSQYAFIEDAITDAMAAVAAIGRSGTTGLAECAGRSGYVCMAGKKCDTAGSCVVGGLRTAIETITTSKRIVGTEAWNGEKERDFWHAFAHVRMVTPRTDATAPPLSLLRRVWRFGVYRLLLVYLLSVSITVTTAWISGATAVGTATKALTAAQECTKDCDIPKQRYRDTIRSLEVSPLMKVVNSFSPPEASDQKENASSELRNELRQVQILQQATDVLNLLSKLVIPMLMGCLGAYIATMNKWLEETTTDNVLNSRVRDKRLIHRTFIGAVLGGLVGWALPNPSATDPMTGGIFLAAFAVGFQTRGFIKLLEDIADRIGGKSGG